MNRSVWVIALAAAFVLAGCRHPAPMMKPASAELSLEQRREMQTREWAAPIDVVFGAAVTWPCLRICDWLADRDGWPRVTPA